MSRYVVALALLLESADALRPAGPVTTRRAAVAGLFGVPAAAYAANPLAFDGEVQFKERNYGNGETPQNGYKPSGSSCPEGTRKSPDGFGGFTCKDKVKSIPNRIFSADGSSPPPPPPAAPPPPKSTGESTRSSASSAPALTVDELIANSIKQKETLLGRPLDDAEKAAMAAKVKALMGI